jgi:ubiquinone/menaquinone biosynthesis C-methylase UbiE
VGFYSRVIFPRLCDYLLGKPFLASYRRELLSTVVGAVLEIGFGTGLNLPHYPAHVRRLTVVEPSCGMHHLAMRRMRESGIAVDWRALRGECLPFADDAFDTVVSTFTLCSIDDVDGALKEAYRVLRPGGRFLFLEHGLSPDPGVRQWQRRLNRLQQWLADGCRLDRNIRELVSMQPFASVQGDAFYLERFPRTHGYLYRGVAAKG